VQISAFCQALGGTIGHLADNWLALAIPPQLLSKEANVTTDNIFPSRKNTMDKLVKRVTVVKVSGESREAKVVYESEHQDDSGEPLMDSLDNLVRRVTLVKVRGENHEVKVVYESEHGDNEDEPSIDSFERGLRRFLKADLIRAQDAYDRHVKSASKGSRGEWLFDVPFNIVKAILKAERETREVAKRENKKAGD